MTVPSVNTATSCDKRCTFGSPEVYRERACPVAPSSLTSDDPSQFRVTKPPWKSGKTVAAFRSAVQAVVPSLVIAWTVSSFMTANTSATPLGLGTAGRIDQTSPGWDQSTVPRGGPAGKSVGDETVTSADAVPAVIVTCPAASAVRMGGSLLDRLTTAGSLDVQVSPVTGCPAALSAWMAWVSPTIMLTMLGISVTPLAAGTVKASALLHAPFCRIRAMPVSAVGATVATTCVS